MRRIVAIAALIALLVPVAVMAGGQGEDEGPISIKLSHDLPEDTPQHAGSVRFKELVEERSGGRLEVQVFPAGQLGSDIETVELMQTGSIEASLVPTAKLSGFDATLQIADLPFLFPSKEVTYCVLDSEVGLSLLSGLEDIGLKGLAFWESGFKQLTASFDISGPDAYDGKKIRVMESPILIEQFRAMGANAIPIDFAEVYNALQQGVVDGQENPLVSITKMRFFEVQDYMAISNHGYLAYAFLFAKSFWDGLDADLQQIIQEAAIEAAAYERQLTADMEQGFIDTIRESGTTIIELTDAEREAFQEATKPVHDMFADQIGRDVLDAVYAKIEECGG